jgi:hypothetical protein
MRVYCVFIARLLDYKGEGFGEMGDQSTFWCAMSYVTHLGRVSRCSATFQLVPASKGA